MTRSPLDSNLSHAYLWPGVLMVGLNTLDNSSHAHCPATLLISLDGPFSIHIEDGPEQIVEAAIIAPNVRRATHASNKRLVDILVDPHTKLFQRLAGALGGKKLVALDKTMSASVQPLCSELFNGKLNSQKANQLLEKVVAAIEQPSNWELDSRVSAAISTIWKLLPDADISSENIAAQVGISSSRLLHLFSEQTGATFRQYILWLRIRLAMNLWADDHPISHIAVGAGFCDQAHFTKTLRRMTDFVPSTLVNTGQYRCINCGQKTDGA